MGVTIHYAGRLTKPTKMPKLLDFVRAFAKSHQWGFRTLQQNESAPPHGFVLFPHPDCEPMAFDFGPRFRFASSVKTQFAGPQVHFEVVRFLRQIQPILGRLGVRDEGEYWNTGNEETFRWHIAKVNELIAEMIAKDPNARSQVTTPDGLIIDLIE